MPETSSRLDASIEAMRQFYPQFSLSGSPIGTGDCAVWKGWVQPIQEDLHLEALLDDLFYDRPVEVFRGGEVRHAAKCKARHRDHDWMEDVCDPFIRYKLEVRYSGTQRHPRAFVREPILLSPRHMWGDDAICGYAAWENIWSWDKHTVVDFMDHALVWLVKTTVWTQAKVWIGSERPHDLRFLLASIRLNEQCRCGSGEPYGTCHGPKDYATHQRNSIVEIFKRRNPF